MGYGHLRETETQKIAVVPGHRLMIQVPLGGPHRPLSDFHHHQTDDAGQTKKYTEKLWYAIFSTFV